MGKETRSDYLHTLSGTVTYLGVKASERSAESSPHPPTSIRRNDGSYCPETEYSWIPSESHLKVSETTPTYTVIVTVL